MQDVTLRQSPVDQATYRVEGIWADETFAQVLRRCVEAHPDRIAVSDLQRELSFEQLEQAILRVAAFLRDKGIGPGDCVAVQLPNCLEFIPAYFAIERVGAIGIPVSIEFRSSELDYVLRSTDCRGVIVAAEYRGFDHQAMVEGLKGDLSNLDFVGVVGGAARGTSHNLDKVIWGEGAPAGFTDAPVDPNAMMRMMFTSGTTGKPKGVTHNHNTSLFPAKMLNGDMEVTEDDVMLLFLPMALNWGYLSILQTVLAGCKLVIMEKFHAAKALEAIQSKRVTYFAAAPASVVSMLNLEGQEKYDLSSLRTVILGGTSCPVETIRAFRKRCSADLIELYGMLECGGYHTYTRRTDDPEAVAGTVGRIGTHMRLRISPRGGIGELPHGEVGEIQSQGPGTQLGYYRRPDANEEAFTEDGWFRSGDLGMIDDGGNLRIVGRLKEMINRGGKKYYPREVEEILYTHPSVLHCAVIGLPDPRLGESNCLCVVPQPGHTPTLQTFVDLLREKVAIYKLPERLVLMESFPMTPTGKFQRHALVKQILENDQAATADALK